jgi:protein SCO1/2
MTVLTRVAALLVPFTLAATLFTAQAAPALKAGVFEPPRQAPEFALRGSDGGELSLARYRGKLVLLSFGFTHCAAVCPVTLATLAQARQALGAQAGAVQVVFVTVDPERDDPVQMKTYLAAFDPSFVGGAGRPEVLAAMRRNYGVVATKVPMASGGYAVDHTSAVLLIDRDGKLRAMMPYGRDAGDYVHDIKLLLAQ